MLKVEHVTKKYGKLIANNDISFFVNSGQIAVLVGPNGAGKSTIIKCISGLLRFDGNITIDGNENKSIEAKRLIGYVPEMPAVYELLTIAEHMEFIRRAYRLPDDGFDKYLLERFELWDKKDKPGKELSICCTLLHKPRVIIFDEPMVGLDPHAIKELKKMFAELKEQGCALLISTHMLDSVEDFWDVAHIMVDGRFAATKINTSDANGDKTLDELFFEITEGKTAEGAQ